MPEIMNICSGLMVVLMIGFIPLYIGSRLFLAREERNRKRFWDQGGEPANLDWDVLLSPEIQRCLPQAKIEAVTRYQKITGAGLKEGNEAIEYLMAYPDRAPSLKKPAKPRSYEMAAQQSSGLRDLLREGKRDEARQIYQAFAGVDQFTASEAIDALETEIDNTDPHSVSSLNESYGKQKGE